MNCTGASPGELTPDRLEAKPAFWASEGSLSLRQERETFSETAVSHAREPTGLGIKTAFRATYGRFGIPMLTF
jgi:hypothetical protein